MPDWLSRTVTCTSQQCRCRKAAKHEACRTRQLLNKGMIKLLVHTGFCMDGHCDDDETFAKTANRHMQTKVMLDVLVAVPLPRRARL